MSTGHPETLKERIGVNQKRENSRYVSIFSFSALVDLHSVPIFAQSNRFALYKSSDPVSVT
jgi:hypothetical protein